MINLRQSLQLAALAAGVLAMAPMAVAQTTKPTEETTKKVEAAQKAETTSAKGQWAPSTAFPMPMEEPVAAVVDGKLYIVQGLTDGGFQPMGVVYMYDPATKVWTKKAPMPEPHVHHGMTTALNGKIYVFGGFMRPGKDLAWQPVNNAWEYSPDTDTWKAIAPLPTKRGGGTATAYNGKIYVIGGATILPGAPDPAIRFVGKPHDMCVGANEEYDPATNSWKARAPMPTARNHFLAGEINGKIYAIGGRLGSTFVTRSSNTDVNEEYDVAQDLWTTKAQMPTARSGVAGGVYKGKVYIGGGEFQNDKIMAAFRAFEAYDAATNTWDQSLPRMRIPRHGFAGAVIGNQLHVVAGDIQTAGIPGVTAYTDTHDVFTFSN